MLITLFKTSIKIKSSIVYRYQYSFVNSHYIILIDMRAPHVGGAQGHGVESVRSLYYIIY